MGQFDEPSAPMPKLPHVLVVDDDAAMLRLMNRVFRKDLDMVLIDDPLEALDLLETQTFDVALVDHTMPRISGLTLAIRGAALQPSMAWIMLTAHDSLPEVRVAIAEGRVHALLPKPWDRNQVLDEIRRVLAARATRPDEP
jgi:DNA-binding NtrC family response regulator